VSMPDDPERLADAGAGSPLAELFTSASRDLPSEQQLGQLAAKLSPVLDAAPAATSAASGTSILVKLGVATGALALLIGAGLSLRRASHPAPGSPTVTPSAVAKAAATTLAPAPVAPAASAAADPAPDDVSPPRAPDNGAAASSKPASAPSKPLGEAALLEQARRALNGSPSSALQLANQHRARFPNGVLTQEREVIAIEALRRLHRSSEAEQRAGGFSKAFPGSAHQRMVDEAPKR
jgi:hypothetical protein